MIEIEDILSLDVDVHRSGELVQKIGVEQFRAYLTKTGWTDKGQQITGLRTTDVGRAEERSQTFYCQIYAPPASLPSVQVAPHRYMRMNVVVPHSPEEDWRLGYILRDIAFMERRSQLEVAWDVGRMAA